MTDPKETTKTFEIAEYEWMLRPCEMYKEEYSDCTGIPGRFNQYFIYGKTQDCSHWKRDYNNCTKWQEKKDERAANELIASEMQRRKERLEAHYANDIWEKRPSPPEDWSKPLPEWMCKDYENTYLGMKAKEMRGENVFDPTMTDRSLCTIM